MVKHFIELGNLIHPKKRHSLSQYLEISSISPFIWWAFISIPFPEIVTPAQAQARFLSSLFFFFPRVLTLHRCNI